MRLLHASHSRQLGANLFRQTDRLEHEQTHARDLRESRESVEKWVS